MVRYTSIETLGLLLVQENAVVLCVNRVEGEFVQVLEEISLFLYKWIECTCANRKMKKEELFVSSLLHSSTTP